MCSKKAGSVLQCAIWVVFALYMLRIYSFDVMKWYMKRRISLTLCTIGCLAHAGQRMIHFLINESRILPKIERPLKHVSLADSAELQGKSGILPLCAMHIWDSPSSQEIFWLLLAVQFWGRKKKIKFLCSGVLRLQQILGQLYVYVCNSAGFLVMSPVWSIVPAVRD